MCGISISKRSDYSPDKTLLMRLDSSENLLGFSLFYFIFLFYIFCLDSIFFLRFVLLLSVLSSRFSALRVRVSLRLFTFHVLSIFCFKCLWFLVWFNYGIQLSLACSFVRSLARTRVRHFFCGGKFRDNRNKSAICAMTPKRWRSNEREVGEVTRGV